MLRPAVKIAPHTAPGGSYRDLECFDSSAAADDGRGGALTKQPAEILRRRAVRAFDRERLRVEPTPRQAADGLWRTPCAEYAGFKCGLVVSVEDLADKLKVR